MQFINSFSAKRRHRQMPCANVPPAFQSLRLYQRNTFFYSKQEQWQNVLFGAPLLLRLCNSIRFYTNAHHGLTTLLLDIIWRHSLSGCFHSSLYGLYNVSFSVRLETVSYLIKGSLVLLIKTSPAIAVAVSQTDSNWSNWFTKHYFH